MSGRRLPDALFHEGESGLSLWSRFFAAYLVVVLASILILGPAPGDLWRLAVVVVLVVAAVVLGTRVLGPSRLGRLWPAIVSFVGLAAAGWFTTGIGMALGGFYIVTFVFVGLTQPPGTATKLLPLAAGCWLATNHPITSSVFARLPVAAGVWLLVGELLARVTADREGHQRELSRRASIDALTGLFNRHGLSARLDSLESGDAVVLVDVDHFKQVNDRLGHEAGDRVLADLGRVVVTVLRSHDVAVRYGGEELLLLLPGTDLPGVERCIERLRVGWAAFHPEMTFSAGVAIVRDGDAQTALRAADAALYRAKAEGRGRTQYAPDEHPDVMTVVLPPRPRDTRAPVGPDLAG